jgi:predicted metalloprotease with PDZ domain
MRRRWPERTEAPPSGRRSQGIGYRRGTLASSECAWAVIALEHCSMASLVVATSSLTRTPPADYFKGLEARRKLTDLTYSVGMNTNGEGPLNEVLWNGPTYKTGLTVGAQIVAVNGTTFDLDRLKSAIQARRKPAPRSNFSSRNDDQYRTVRIDYHDVLR